jgi:hypothetical protein
MNKSANCVIFGGVDKFDGQPMFWSNKQGWVDLNDATVFPDWYFVENREGWAPTLVPHDQYHQVVLVRLPCLTPAS